MLPRHRVTLVVVIPVGPTCVLDHILDTIESVQRYTTPDRQIIIVDDSHKGTGGEVASRASPIDVIETPRNYGHGGGLYKSLSLGYAHAVARYRFEALLRLDTDALVIGPEPEQAAIDMFQRNPQAAIGGWIVHNGLLQARLRALRDGSELRENARRLLQRPYSLFRMRVLRMNLTLRRLYFRALKNGYGDGDHVFGGAYFLSETFLRRLKQAGLLPHALLGMLTLEEDQIFGVLAKTVRMEIADMQTGDLPFACAWKHLPGPPEQLLAQRKKIVHSIRLWEQMSEGDIRAYFRRERQRGESLDASPGEQSPSSSATAR